MATPQAGLFALSTRTHHHLKYEVRAGADVGEIAAAMARLGEPNVTGGGDSIVIGCGAGLAAVSA
ncbi:MAG TPA: hypothetical protein VMY16_00195 [Ilumatobacteraceae bacterium]|nr:hypothetical protein [Ilumatobacteraceae bacterium]